MRITERVVAIVDGAGNAAHAADHSLSDLRKLAGLSQAEIAHRLAVGQAAISKIEHRGDVQISSLQRYIAALGGKLRIEVVFPPDCLISQRLKEELAAKKSTDGQLTLPLLFEEDQTPFRRIVLSIKPEYSRLIMERKKTVELRRRFPTSPPPGTIALIYSTAPDKSLVGLTQIANVKRLPISDIWNTYSHEASIDRADFDSYFEGCENGYALLFKDAQAFSRPLALSELRQRFGFQPPQSFAYATSTLTKALEYEYSEVFN